MMNLRHLIGPSALAASLAFVPVASSGVIGNRPVLNVPDASVYAGSMRLDADGTPRALYRVDSPSYAGTPEQSARAFLAEHAAFLRLDNAASSLSTERVIAVPGGAHVRFLQEYRGLPVNGADVVVSLSPSGRVTWVLNNFHAGLALDDIVPSLLSSEAIATARSALGITGASIGKADEASLCVGFDSSGSARLAWAVSITSETPAGDWAILVDARDGTVLRSEDRFVMHHDGYMQGSGMVYLQDPLTAAGRMYGTPGFIDGDDADTDSLTFYRTPVVLDSLTMEDGTFQLKGPWCTVTDIESPADPVSYAALTSDGFAYTRSEQGFEAVNAYYHVSTACRYVESLGFVLPRLRTIRLDPHGFQGEDNSHYSPSGNWIAWGEGGVDDAEDADVIWHEYGHAIQFAIVPTWGGGESAALGEGISDYLAASYARSIGGWTAADYHYNWLFDWDGHNPFWAGRITNDSRTYPFGPIPVHSAGQVLSAALMGIHAALGRDITDRLVLKALCYLGAGVRGPDFAQAVIQADDDVYAGIHRPTLVYWLGTVKHFIDPNQYAAGVGSEGGIPDRFVLGRNYPNPFNPTTSIPFSLGEASRVRLEIFDTAGRLVATLLDGEESAGAHTAVWDGRTVNGTEAGSGVYFCRLQSLHHTGAVRTATGSMVLLR